MDLTVNANYTTTRALGLNYRTFLLDQNELIVTGTIVGGDWFVDGGSIVDVNSVDLTNANWTVDEGTVLVDNDMADDSGELTVNANGTVEVGTDGSGNLLANEIDINAGGLVDVDDNVDVDTSFNVNGGTITAATAGTGVEGVGQFIIQHDGTATIAGEVRIPSGSRLEYGDITSTGNTLSAGSLNFSATSSILAMLSGASAPSLSLSVSGDITIETTAAAGTVVPFDSRGVTLTLDGNSAQDMEIVTPDYDVNSVIVWQGIQNCTGAEVIYNVMPLAELIVESGATVDLTDDNENILRGTAYSQDALYVDGDVTVQSGATLDLGSYKLYYTGTLTEDGTITGTDEQVTKVCYGDFDADGDVDAADVANFSTAFMGSAVEANDPLFSSNRDGDVDLGDYAVLVTQVTGTNVPCPVLNCGESGGGELTIEDLATFTLTYLTAQQVEDFAERLYAAAEGAGETQEATDMAELAYLITEE